jgi:hypothetical protein
MAGDEALAVIEVGEAAGSGAAILIVDAGDEGDAGGRDVVDRLGEGVGALKVESFGEVMRNGGLQAVVVRIGVGIEGFEQGWVHSLVGSTRQSSNAANFRIVSISSSLNGGLRTPRNS